MCKGLLEDLIERGLDIKKSYLFVIDGSKAIRKAIINVFGKKAKIQRCQFHKRRNVLSHLPEKERWKYEMKLKEAYNQRSYNEAKRKLKKIKRELEKQYPSASRSLEEGMEETLTILKIPIPETLRKVLRTTNPIEGVFSTLNYYTGRVKNWRNDNEVGGKSVISAGKIFP